METAANLLALVLLISAGYLLTVRTWHQKDKFEDFTGGFDKKIDGLISKFESDPPEGGSPEKRIDDLSRRVLILAGIMANKIKQDHRSAKDDINRAKTGIFFLFGATFIQILIIIFGHN